MATNCGWRADCYNFNMEEMPPAPLPAESKSRHPLFFLLLLAVVVFAIVMIVGWGRFDTRPASGPQELSEAEKQRIFEALHSAPPPSSLTETEKARIFDSLHSAPSPDLSEAEKQRIFDALRDNN